MYFQNLKTRFLLVFLVSVLSIQIKADGLFDIEDNLPSLPDESISVTPEQPVAHKIFKITLNFPEEILPGALHDVRLQRTKGGYLDAQEVRRSDFQISYAAVAFPGTYLLKVDGISVNLKEDTYKRYGKIEHNFTVVSNDIPTPDPDVPVIPDPPVPVEPTTIKSLVTEAQAKQLAIIHRDFANNFKKYDKVSVPKFADSYYLELSKRGLENHKASSIVEKRIEDCIGGSEVITGKVRVALYECLFKIAEEFEGSSPEPDIPPIEEGKRFVIIVRESSNISTKQSALENTLRTDPENIQAIYGKGHILLILDPQDADAEGTSSNLINLVKDSPDFKSLPAVFILDQETKNLIKSQPVTSSTQIIELLQASGG